MSSSSPQNRQNTWMISVHQRLHTVLRKSFYKSFWRGNFLSNIIFTKVNTLCFHYRKSYYCIAQTVYLEWPGEKVLFYILIKIQAYGFLLEMWSRTIAGTEWLPRCSTYSESERQKQSVYACARLAVCTHACEGFSVSHHNPSDPSKAHWLGDLSSCPVFLRLVSSLL